MNLNFFISILVLSCLSFITTYLGVWLAYLFKKNRKVMALGMGFSAGIMIMLSCFELIPEAASQTGLPLVMTGVLAGVFLIYILNLILPHTHFCQEKGRVSFKLKTAYLIAFGLVLHDFPEGFALASSYMHSAQSGILVAISIALHNLPEEFALAVPLVKTEKKKVLHKMAFISALAEPLGAVAGFLIVVTFLRFNHFLLAFAAGAMIFISLHELFPAGKKCQNNQWFIPGFITSVIIFFILKYFII
ncbi:MAG TPA: ZIP family metal transporter [bacterium]|nr:ZIP family metal transporter [bacterium]